MITRCELVRESLSARFDGEEMPIAVAAVEAHLGICGACREFQALLAALDRRMRMRLRLAEPVSDHLGEEVLTSLRNRDTRLFAKVMTRRVARRRSRTLRVTQWAAAVIPLAIAAPALTLGAFTHPHVVPSHVGTPCTISLVHQMARTRPGRGSIEVKHPASTDQAHEA